jgi:hypothetical protein
MIGSAQVSCVDRTSGRYRFRRGLHQVNPSLRGTAEVERALVEARTPLEEAD